jgi:hypothetical protein
MAETIEELINRITTSEDTALSDEDLEQLFVFEDKNALLKNIAQFLIRSATKGMTPVESRQLAEAKYAKPELSARLNVLAEEAEEEERLVGGGRTFAELRSITKAEELAKQKRQEALPTFQRTGFQEDRRPIQEIEATGIETPQEKTKRRQAEFKIAEKSKRERFAAEKEALDIEEQIRQLNAQAEAITTTAAEKYVDAARTYEKTFGAGPGRDSTPLKLMKMQNQITAWRQRGFHEQADALEATRGQISDVFNNTPKPWEIRQKLESQAKRASGELIAQATHLTKKLNLLRGEQTALAVPGIDFPVAVEDQQSEQPLPGGVREEDIQFTMQQESMTREQVLNAIQGR